MECGGNPLSWESANIFLGPWCKGNTLQGCILVHYTTQLMKWGKNNYSKCPPACLWSGPSCQELGTSGEALISDYCVPVIFGRRTLVKSRRKRSRFCLHEHIFTQLAQHEITSVQWRISPQTQKHQTLENSMSVISHNGWLVFSVWPSSCR